MQRYGAAVTNTRPSITDDPEVYSRGVTAANNGCTCAIILEHGFHTNAKDAAFLVRDENLRMLAAAEAQIIADYFGLAVSSASPSAAAAASTVKIMGRNILSDEQMSAFLTGEKCRASNQVYAA